MIPRATVATALGLPVDTDTLPPGDLPLDRFAARYVAYLSAPEHDSETPDAWTGAVMDHLIDTAPETALAAILAGLPHDPDHRLADPLAELGDKISQDTLTNLAEATPAFAALIDRANAPE